MHDDESVQDPPAPRTPPAPTGEAIAPIQPETDARDDNPIAVAGLVVSVLALILSMIVIGAIVGIVSFVLCVIGLRRSRTSGRGRGLSIGGIMLSLLALLVSAAAAAFIIATITSGEDTILNGVATTSSNHEFPPQNDIESVECSASESGSLPLAIITVRNNSEGRSVYRVTVEWETSSGEIADDVRSDFIDVGETETLRLFERSSAGIPDTCRVTRIERSGFRFLN